MLLYCVFLAHLHQVCWKKMGHSRRKFCVASIATHSWLIVSHLPVSMNDLISASGGLLSLEHLVFSYLQMLLKEVVVVLQYS